MIRKLFVLLYLLLFSLSTIADDSCVRSKPKPIVIAEHPEVASYKINTDKKGFLIEDIQLNTGQKFYISQYGCAHFGLSYKFELDKAFDGNLIASAKQFLTLISGIAPTFTKSLNKSLTKIPDDFPTPDLITLQPGYDWIYLKTEAKNKKHYFIITYDIAL